MTKAVGKAKLFARLGYGPPYEELERALAEAGLSRPARGAISPRKAERVEALLASLFVAVCPRGDCQADAADGEDRRIVPAATQADCAVCGGSANARAVDGMVAAWRRADLGRLCVVGGSPNARTELEALVDGRLDLRLIDGTANRNAGQAAADLAWADRVAIWGGTQLDHHVSNKYRGPHVVQFAKRSIGVLAREMVRAVEGERS